MEILENILAFFTASRLTLLVLLISVLFFMRGKVRPDLVALCTLLALLLFDILDVSEALSGFSSPVVIMMAGLFVVGAGIFRTGLAKMISTEILKLGRGNENLLFVLVMLTTAFIGAFVSNTGTVAVMMPIVISMAAGANLNVRRYLMPIAFASSMGLFTLISTPPNLVINDSLANSGFEGLSFFSFAPVGAIILTIGVIYLFFASKTLSAKKQESKKRGEQSSVSKLVEDYKLKQHTFKLKIGEKSPLVNKTLEELHVSSRYNVYVGSIVRHVQVSRLRKKTVEELAGPKSLLQAGDTVYCYGMHEDIGNFVNENRLKPEDIQENENGKVSGDFGMAEVYVLPNSGLRNHTIEEIRFRDRYDVKVLGLKHNGQYKDGRFKDIKIESGDALLIYGTWDKIIDLADYQEDMLLVGQPQKEAQKVTLDSKAPLAAIIMLLMIVTMVFNILPATVAIISAAAVMVISGCLRNMEEAYGSINWSSVLLIAAMMPMATAFEKTGITGGISGWMLDSFTDAGPHVMLAVVYFGTSLITMVLSNTATAVLFAPIAMQAATGMGLSPYPFMFAVAVAASMCFASPFSTAPNVMVMSAGEYSFGDYVKTGLPLQLTMGIVMIFILPVIFPF